MTIVLAAERALTFDMRGGRKHAKLACGRPLDGGVRALCVEARKPGTLL